MLKINLLPPYIHQKKMVKVAAGVVTVLLVGEIVVMLAMRAGPEAEKARMTEQLNKVQTEFARLNPLKTEADAILAAEGGMAPKFDFLTGMDKYNTEYPDLYARTAAYTYREATILNLSASANQLQFDAYVSRPRDVSLLILGLSRSSDFTGLPQVTGVPGFDPAKEAEREQAANAALPDATIIGGLAPGAGYPGMTGAEGGYPGMGGGNGPGMPGEMGGGPMMPGMEMSAAGGNGPGMPGMEGGMGGGGGKGDLSKLGIDQAIAKPRGFTVSVTCALRTTITRPKYGSSDQQAGASGGGGGFGGDMGMSGMPGMAGGMNGP